MEEGSSSDKALIFARNEKLSALIVIICRKCLFYRFMGLVPQSLQSFMQNGYIIFWFLEAYLFWIV